MANIRKVLYTIMVVGGLFIAVLNGATQTALADSVGQCNVVENRTITSPSEELSALSQEGVLHQATQKVYSHAGYTHSKAADESTRQWFKRKVVETNTLNGFFGKDFMCRNGTLSLFEEKGYERETQVFAVLPAPYNTSNSRTHSTSEFTERKVISVWVIGLGSCGNPFLGKAKIVIWVRKKHHKKVAHPSTPPVEEKKQAPKEEPKPKPEEKSTPPPPTPSTPLIELSNLRKLEPKDKGEAATPGGNEPITVELSDSGGDIVELTFHSELGHFEESTFLVNWSGKYQETLYIPKAPGVEEDTYWVSATDLKTGQKVETEHWKYAIKPLDEFY